MSRYFIHEEPAIIAINNHNHWFLTYVFLCLVWSDSIGIWGGWWTWPSGSAWRLRRGCFDDQKTLKGIQNTLVTLLPGKTILKLVPLVCVVMKWAVVLKGIISVNFHQTKTFGKYSTLYNWNNMYHFTWENLFCDGKQNGWCLKIMAWRGRSVGQSEWRWVGGSVGSSVSQCVSQSVLVVQSLS